jgi:alkylation response protein AidB-like acyl-CoA dehydrogenase
MNFHLSPEQQAVRETAQSLAAEAAAEAAHLDRQSRFPDPILRRFAAAGMFGLALPAEYGGRGLDYVSYCLAQMELAQACPTSALLLHLNHSLVGATLAHFGTPAQKERYLPQVAQGRTIACFALTEPEAGSDPGGLRTVARREGDHYLLSGTKNFVTAGDRATFGIIMALTAPEKGPKGISAFLVDLEATPGLTRGAPEAKMSLKGASSVTLEFTDAPVPVDSLLGAPEQGLKIALAALDGARVGAAAQAVGLGRAALQHALAYARRRHQFGQPLAQLQAIQWKLADMATEVEAAALLTLKAAWLRDQGRPYGTAAAMAKKYATDAALGASLEAVQIFGGYGLLEEHPVERLLRDAKAGQIYEGTNEIMRLIIARELLKT